MPVYRDPAEGLTIRVDRVRDWTAGLIEAIGALSDIAADLAEVLVASGGAVRAALSRATIAATDRRHAC